MVLFGINHPVLLITRRVQGRVQDLLELIPTFSDNISNST